MMYLGVHYLWFTSAKNTFKNMYKQIKTVHTHTHAHTHTHTHTHTCTHTHIHTHTHTHTHTQTDLLTTPSDTSIGEGDPTTDPGQSNMSTALQSTSHQAQKLFGYMKEGAGSLFKNIKDSSSKMMSSVAAGCV